MKSHSGPKDGVEFLDQVPPGWWKRVPNDMSGCQYVTRVTIMDAEIHLLLDKGSAANSVAEGVVQVVRRAAVSQLVLAHRNGERDDTGAACIILENYFEGRLEEHGAARPTAARQAAQGWTRALQVRAVEHQPAVKRQDL